MTPETDKGPQTPDSEAEKVSAKISEKPQDCEVQMTAAESEPSGSHLPFGALKNRQEFVAKVFAVQIIMYALPAFGALFPFFFPPERNRNGEVIREHSLNEFLMDYRLFVFVPAIAVGITYFVLLFVEFVRRRYPWNIIVFSIYSVSAALSLLFFPSLGFGIALTAVALTSLAVVAYANFTSYDFITKGFFFFCVGCSCILFACGFPILYFFGGEDRMTWMLWDLFFPLIIVLVFPLCFAWNTKRILRGRFQLAEDEWAFGAVIITFGSNPCNVRQMC